MADGLVIRFLSVFAMVEANTHLLVCLEGLTAELESGRPPARKGNTGGRGDPRCWHSS